MSNDEEKMYGEFLNDCGLELDFNNRLWMEEKLDDFSVRDLIGIIKKFHTEYCGG